MFKELVNTPTRDLTIKDHLKWNGVVLAAMAGIYASVIGVGAGLDKVDRIKANRQYKKNMKDLSTEEG